MKYLLMIINNPALWESVPEDEQQAVSDGHDAFRDAARATGELVGWAGLHDPAQSSTVRVRDGAMTVTDGPFMEAKEFFAGYYVVDCDSLTRARELAAMIPNARYTAIEVRPVEHSSGAQV